MAVMLSAGSQACPERSTIPTPEVLGAAWQLEGPLGDASGLVVVIQYGNRDGRPQESQLLGAVMESGRNVSGPFGAVAKDRAS